jgi:predicted MPP superfamily phosphohydrolase
MDRSRLRMAPAFAALYMLVTTVNYYVVARLTGLLDLENKWISLTYAFGLSTLILVGFLFRTSSGRGTKGLFVAVTTVYGLEIAALSALILFEIFNLIFNFPEMLSGQIMLGFVFFIAVVSLINAQMLSVRTIKIPFVRKLRVAQLSDVHIGAVHGKKYLARIVAMVNELKPDFILITGDIVSGAVAPGSSQLENFAKLEAPAYMAPGNHEHYEGMDEIRAALPKNIEILRDQEKKFDGYSIFGLDFVQEQGVSGSRKIEKKFDAPVIVMAHVPQFLDLPEGSIILAGHYHAGQIFPLNWVGGWFIKQFKGIYTEKGVTLYISPGTATWGPPMRFGSRNEVTLLELG